MPEIGRPAPEFTLPHKPGGDPVRLADFRGESNVVLLFFPLAWSSVCTRELCSVRDDYDRYRGLDATVLGISVDSPFALQRWSEEQGFPFPLLSDFNRRVSRDYDALYDDLMGLEGVSKRAAFVIDREGVLCHAQVLENAGEQPDFAAVERTLESIQGTG